MKNVEQNRSTSYIFHPTSKGFTPTPLARPKVWGFTLLELLVVIAILAVLAAVLVVVINPAELLKRARDAQRMSDLRAISSAVNRVLVDRPDAFAISPTIVHISLPDTSPACASHPALPRLPATWTYHCVTAENLRRVDGTGWIPINFTVMPAGSPLAALPIDPINSAENGLFYAYVTGGSWEITAVLEAEMNRSRERVGGRDGGDHNFLFEIGSNLRLTPSSLQSRVEDPLLQQGLVAWWPFDNHFQDLSGLGNHGTPLGGVAFALGRQGQAVRLDGVDGRVSVPDSDSLDVVGPMTVAMWAHSIVRPAVNSDALLHKGGAYFFEYRAGHDLEFWVVIGTAQLLRLSHINLATEWHHIVATYDPTTTTRNLFINGVLRRTVTTSGLVNISASPVVIGGHHPVRTGDSASMSVFNGLIDEVRIYNRALTADEIRAIFEATR